MVPTPEPGARRDPDPQSASWPQLVPVLVLHWLKKPFDLKPLFHSDSAPQARALRGPTLTPGAHGARLCLPPSVLMPELQSRWLPKRRGLSSAQRAGWALHGPPRMQSPPEKALPLWKLLIISLLLFWRSWGSNPDPRVQLPRPSKGRQGLTELPGPAWGWSSCSAAE